MRRKITNFFLFRTILFFVNNFISTDLKIFNKIYIFVGLISDPHFETIRPLIKVCRPSTTKLYFYVYLFILVQTFNNENHVKS